MLKPSVFIMMVSMIISSMTISSIPPCCIRISEGAGVQTGSLSWRSVTEKTGREKVKWCKLCLKFSVKTDRRPRLSLAGIRDEDPQASPHHQAAVNHLRRLYNFGLLTLSSGDHRPPTFINQLYIIWLVRSFHKNWPLHTTTNCCAISLFLFLVILILKQCSKQYYCPNIT